MSEIIRVRQHNAVFLQISCDDGIIEELREHFTFEIPDAKYQKRYKLGQWDGKIRLLQKRHKETGLRNTLYVGLLGRLYEFCKDRGYQIELDSDSIVRGQSVTDEQIQKFITDLAIPAPIVPRPYQIDYLESGIKLGRALFVSPTASGKSLIIYLLRQWYAKEKALVVVPTTGLVRQFAQEFSEYGYDPELIHQISGGERWTDKPTTITTWQSAYTQPQEWFDQFGLVFGDEAHNFKATSLKTLMEGLRGAYKRFGTTGTLDGTETNQLVLEGLFGPTRQHKTTRELIDEGYISDLFVNVIKLTHPLEIRKQYWAPKATWTYQQEYEYLIGCEARNRKIAQLALTRKGNTLLLFTRIETHGRLIHDMITNDPRAEGRKIFFAYGGTKVSERDQIRGIVEKEQNAIICASYGTFGEGINIKRLNDAIFASPYKSKRMVLQPTGRGLRKTDDPSMKDKLTVWDFADDIGKETKSRKTGEVTKKPNHTLRHMMYRIQLYAAEQFEYKITEVAL